MSALLTKQCKPCDASTPPLPPAERRRLLDELPDWSSDGEGRVIRRSFAFKDYHETLAFVNAVAWIAHREDHHPDLEVSCDKCVVRYTTHAVGGLSENDFICAAKVSRLVE